MVAPLGTALTEHQAGLLYGHDQVIIATDADTAGRTAAERDYWQLTAWGINPAPARLPEGSDPTSILTGLGPTTLERILDKATPAAVRVPGPPFRRSGTGDDLQKALAVRL